MGPIERSREKSYFFVLLRALLRLLRNRLCSRFFFHPELIWSAMPKGPRDVLVVDSRVRTLGSLPWCALGMHQVSLWIEAFLRIAIMLECSRRKKRGANRQESEWAGWIHVVVIIYTLERTHIHCWVCVCVCVRHSRGVRASSRVELDQLHYGSEQL